MGSPKHLWSGDWEDESAAAAARRAPSHAPDPAAVASAPAGPRRSSRTRGWSIGAATTLALVLAAVAVALAGRDRSTPARPVAQTPTAQANPGTGQPTPQGSLPIPALPGLVPSGPANSGSLPGAGQAWLGVELARAPSQTPGVLVAGIIAGGPADAAALRPGDIILAIDNQAMRSPQQVGAFIGALHPGQTISIAIDRAGARSTIQATLSQSPGGP